VSQSHRVRYPEAEARLPWLASLLDAYAVLDAGIGRAVAASGRQIACRPGCATCCRIQSIPASTLEILGLKWFAMERLPEKARWELVRSLRRPGMGVCPFLVAGACSVYPLRPMACREFVMLGRSCRTGENPMEHRPGDMLPLPAQAQQEAFSILLRHYGAFDAAGHAQGLGRQVVLRDTRTLQTEDWSGLWAALSCKIPVDSGGGGE